MDKVVRCSNDYCYHYKNGVCTDETVINKIIKDDTIYTEVYECEDKINDMDKEDPLWYDRMLFEISMDEESNRY
jgi:hypothetical protein